MQDYMNSRNAEQMLDEKLENREMTYKCRVLKKVIKCEDNPGVIERIEFNACAAFSPAISHHELLRGSGTSAEHAAQPAAWSFDAALLFVDISGFTNLCTRLDIDVLQAHINNYFTRLIDVVFENDGDVVRPRENVLCYSRVTAATQPCYSCATAALQPRYSRVTTVRQPRYSRVTTVRQA